MMEDYKKRKLAKEWLIFVCCFVPTVIFWTYVTRNDNPPFLALLLFLESKKGENLSVWIGALLPYLLVQLIRSTAWAIKMLRSK
jgi:hypothetical protein